MPAIDKTVSILLATALATLLASSVMAVSSECDKNYNSCLERAHEGGDNVGHDCCDCAKDCAIEGKSEEMYFSVLAAEVGALYFPCKLLD